MDDEWAPILKKDVLFSSTANIDEDDFKITPLDLDYYNRKLNIKMEPGENGDDTDYHGSSTGSPSSSLSSPHMKDQLCVDLNFGVPFSNANPFLHSPASSSGSPFMMFPSCGQQASPLPPVSNFSQQHHQIGQMNQQMSPIDVLMAPGHGMSFGPDGMSFFDDTMSTNQMSYPTSYDIKFEDDITFEIDEQRSPSPPTSDRSSPMDNAPSMIGLMQPYDLAGSFNGAMHGGCMIPGGLTAAQQQLKTRSKVHEMAIKQRLITDQDPRSQGMVQLSAEESCTLVQEGYHVPTKLPLTKGEEEALKIVRRKIRNKLSAQESRRKRKEYMDTLEHRCQGYFSENTQLKGRVRQLEFANKQLAVQLKKLQEMYGAVGSEQ